MRVITVRSTVLATVGYDEARELLRVEFCGRAVYHYFGVPASLHQELLGAPSKGRYYNQAIRGRFPFCRISELQAGAPDTQCPSRAGGGR